LVAVSGRAFRITSHGFVLAGDRRSIFVAGRPRAFRDVESGERIRVRGELERISRFRSDTIRRALDTTTDSRRPPARVNLGRTPSKRGRPFLVLRDISGT
jgi:hypothetical protein